ncbi:MAG: hypothetical protein Q9168_003825 [Polycauliona sp. 1 TL-2023]
MSLTLSSLATDNVLYSFQDAFLSFSNTTHDVHGNNVATLLSTGCVVGNGLRNCEVACQDPNMIFDNTATLHNCLHYPSIIHAISEQTLDDGSNRIAQDYGISAADAARGISTINTIQQCLADYASSTPDPTKYSSATCTGLSPSLCFNHTDICQSVYAPVIEDIAGVGIYTSYWMQNGIALVAFALLRLFDFWIYYLTLAFLGCFRGFERAKVKAEWAKRSGLRHRVPNLISALFEFQKAQCFFMIAVQAAAIIIVKGGGFDAKTLQQLSNSYSAITLVAICGYLPVVFTLLNLHGAGQDSWYVIALSTVTVVIAGVTAFTTKRFVPSPNDLADLRNVTGSWLSCGKRNPTTFCLSNDTVDPFSFGGGVKHTFIFCIIVLGFLVLDKLRTSLHLSLAKATTQTTRSPHHIKTASPKQRTVSGFSTLSRLSVVQTYYGSLNMETKKIISNVVYGCIWMLFLFFYGRCIFLLSKWINGQSGVIGPSTWSFGQIVGITVWVPSLIQYLYLETRGMVAWFEQHIAGDYHVVHHHPPVEP